ncbi:MAG: exodeoxyribonuclease V subunit alpha [Deltaproteobacteria bacterium]|nr:exodeoxyribonuclease V subunit alpha [Deltaproteobacteria bacterium]
MTATRAQLDAWEALLTPLFDQKVLSPLDYRFALTLGRLAPEPPSDEVILGAAAASAALTRGDICLELSRAQTLLIPVEEDASLSVRLTFPEPALWKRALEASPLVSDGSVRAPLVLQGDRLYLHRYFDYQQRLARALLARKAKAFELDPVRLGERLDRLFASASPDPSQRHAAEIAVRRGLSIISGGPGTGKTSTVVRILGALLEDNPELRAVLVAPTGKAAARLAESIRTQRASLDLAPAIAAKIPEEASTIHRRLGYRFLSPTRFTHDAKNPLPADVVILDEASMVDLATMTKLVEAVPPRARLIMLGDKDQLASVAAGHVLGDIAEAAGPERPLAESFALLTRSHRFSAESGIGALARAIQAGRADEVLAILAAGSADVTWHDHDEATLERIAVEGLAPLSAPATLASPRLALDALPAFQILCAHRRGRWGAERIADEVTRWLAVHGKVPRGELWYPGRPVIVVVNDHAQNLWNGDTGVTLRDADGVLRVHFPRPSDDPTGAPSRALSIAQLPSHQPYYAATIHKAQGSGFRHVVAVLPAEPSPVVTRELLYTAVTRAQSKVTLFAPEAVIRHAVTTRVERASGLGAALSRAAR